ncbi:MAG: class I SAM-dependent methyltransferase [Flammeovirgaceae bacterium]
MAEKMAEFFSRYASKSDGRYFLLSQDDGQSFEDAYIQLRKKEQRLYSDDDVRALPDVQPNHVHAKEWLVRKRSAEKLLTYLTGRRPKMALEIGCGNGWLTHLLARVCEETCGLDLNKTELNQAAMVFKAPHIFFAYGDIFTVEFPRGCFDAVVLASSAQYFPHLPLLINRLLELLSDDGEIHFLDTAFYSESEIAAARQRTCNYFASAGYPQMSNFYHHHSFSGLKGFDWALLYNPSSVVQRGINLFNKSASPFPWIVVRKSI